MKHLHHIIPKHMGGTDDPSNLIELTVEEHAEAHRKLWEEHGRWQDYVAWCGLSGRMTCEETVKAAQRGFFTDEKRREWSERMRVNRRSGRVVNKPNVNAKQYNITAPDGTVNTITNLRAWAESMGFNYKAVRNVACGNRNSHYGYKVELNG